MFIKFDGILFNTNVITKIQRYHYPKTFVIALDIRHNELETNWNEEYDTEQEMLARFQELENLLCDKITVSCDNGIPSVDEIKELISQIEEKANLIGEY